MKNAIIYLHGFNSASLDLAGQLLVSKEKLAILQTYCQENAILLLAPNVDYRDFSAVVETCLFEWNQLLDKGYQVVFMGTSMGGFTSAYLALKTGAKAVMINPAVTPSELLQQSIGENVNTTTGLVFDWQISHCQQFKPYEQEMKSSQQALDLTLLLDMADELIDAEQTCIHYHNKARIISFAGGSHSFEHMRQALPKIANIWS